METKVTFNVLECIEKIFNCSKNSKLEDAYFVDSDQDLKLLSDHLFVDRMAAILFANAFVMCFDEACFVKIFEHLGLNPFQVLKYRNSIDSLYAGNLLINTNRRQNQISRYSVSQHIINTVSKNLVLNQIKPTEEVQILNFVDLLQEFSKMSQDLNSEEISKFYFNSYLLTLCEQNLDMPIFREIKNYRLDHFETYFFLTGIWDAVNCGENDFNTNIQNTTNEFYTQKSQALIIARRVIEKQTKLSKLNLIEISKKNFMNRPYAKLSSKVIEFLKEHHDISLDDISNEGSQLILSKNIKAKRLFYNAEESAQISQISNILRNSKFIEMQKCLAEKAMPVGITVIFHGVPGTGKTESVFQLARNSARKILKVDISETKSMWFGESQKLVKKIFMQYQELKSREEFCPILLFNEADAVIGKRKSAGSSNVADTENAVQNIILEELENFEGILFATTNLVENMDAAFERRFLFKVKFEQPSPENSASIWKEKLQFLSDKESLELSKQFNFSGGEMENIARKSVMEEILSGKRSTFKLVENLCKNEKWSGEVKGKIGF